jgi:hypothetical protein
MVLLSSDSPAEGIFERSITTLCSMVAAPLNGVCLETLSDGSTRQHQTPEISPSTLDGKLALARPLLVPRRQDLHAARDGACIRRLEDAARVDLDIFETPVCICRLRVIVGLGEKNGMPESLGERVALEGRAVRSQVQKQSIGGDVYFFSTAVDLHKTSCQPGSALRFRHPRMFVNRKC